jgi:hypothetical protein
MFMVPPYGARAWGMAGAVIARIDDESAVDWNPAGIARCPRTAGVAYVELVPDAFVTQAQAVYVQPIAGTRDPETGVVSHVAGAMLTTMSFDVGEGQTYTENHLRVAYAYSPQPLVSFGFAGELFVSKSGVTGFDAWGTAVDLAARLSITHAWSLAVVGRDIFSRYSFDDGRDSSKEEQYIVGLAHSSSGLSFEIDTAYLHEGWLRTMVGAETSYLFNVVALRGGVTLRSVGEARTTYSFGTSVRMANRLFLHYGVNLDEEDAFGTIHRFSLAVRI